MPGAGKSSLGPLLAKKLGKSFIDADSEVQKAYEQETGRPASDMSHSEFVERENRFLIELEIDNCVIAVGGRAIYCQEAMNHLAEISKIVYLEIDYETMRTRILKDQKLGKNFRRCKEEDLRAVYDERLPLYEKISEQKLTLEQVEELLQTS